MSLWLQKQQPQIQCRPYPQWPQLRGRANNKGSITHSHTFHVLRRDHLVCFQGLARTLTCIVQMRHTPLAALFS